MYSEYWQINLPPRKNSHILRRFSLHADETSKLTINANITTKAKKRQKGQVDAVLYLKGK